MSLKYDSFYHPLGRGNAAINFENTIKNMKSRYFNKVNKDILVSCVYNKNKDKYMFFFKVPSEENEKYPTALMYDVVLEFIPPSNGKTAAKESATLKSYEINMFSNSPGFVFTFAYIIKNKYRAAPQCVPNNFWSKIAITKAPEVRNINQIMTLEKTTWWCLFHLDYNGYLNKNQIQTIMSDKNEGYLLKKMVSQPEKLKEINSVKEVLKEEKLRQKALDNIKSKDFKKIRSEGRDPLAYDFEVSNKPKLKNSLFNSILGKNPELKKAMNKLEKKNNPSKMKKSFGFSFKK